MKLTVERDVLLGTLKDAKGACGKNICIEAGHPYCDGIKVKATNCITYHTATILSTRVVESDIVVVAFKALENAVSGMPAGSVLEVETDPVDNNRLRITHNNSTAMVADLCDEEGNGYPSFFIGTTDQTTEIPTAEFRKLLATCTYCISEDTNRPSLQCLNLSFGENGTLDGTALDGPRLASYHTDALEGIVPDEKVINIDILTARHLQKLVAKAKAPYVSMAQFSEQRETEDFARQWTTFVIDGIRVDSAPVVEAFPSFDSLLSDVMDSVHSVRVQFDPSAILPGVARIAKAAKDIREAAYLAFSPTGAVLSFTDKDFCEHIEALDIRPDFTMTVPLNVGYLEEAVKRIVAICPKGNKAAIVIKSNLEPVGIVYGQARHIVMPMSGDG